MTSFYVLFIYIVYPEGCGNNDNKFKRSEKQVNYNISKL